MMIPNFFDELFSFIITALFTLGAVGFFVAWCVTLYAYFTRKIPSFIAIVFTSVFAFACAFLSAWQVASTKATKKANVICLIKERDALAAGKDAVNKGLLAIIEEQKRRLDVADAATKTANASAKRLASQLEQAETKRFNIESQINEKEKDLPQNPTCVTSSALYRELSD